MPGWAIIFLSGLHLEAAVRQLYPGGLLKLHDMSGVKKARSNRDARRIGLNLAQKIGIF